MNHCFTERGPNLPIQVHGFLCVCELANAWHEWQEDHYDEPEEAIRIANGTTYGLAAGVFTGDLDRATWAADRLVAGQVYVNEWYAGGVETPFGGMGKSGFGREKGQEALANYYQSKNVGIRRLAS